MQKGRDVVCPSETTEHHCHHHEDECVFVLSGAATAFRGLLRLSAKSYGKGYFRHLTGCYKN
jgi:mannose-6-phosphate isomerase-like protein (cupin superfamily)